jgi:CRISPR/Cas system-associated endonuclease Cas1
MTQRFATHRLMAEILQGEADVGFVKQQGSYTITTWSRPTARFAPR